MENEYSRHVIYGNYLSMQGQDFPMDCETLAALQNNMQKLAVIASVAGCDRLVLTGCKSSGRLRTEGYVFIRSSENPLTGEILYHPAQILSDYCHIEETGIDVTANSVEYPEAYTQRHLASGNGNGAMLWASFVTLDDMSLSALLDAVRRENSDRAAAIRQLADSPSVKFVRGMIMMWSGSVATIPDGWALCDGSTHTIDGVQVRTPNLCHKFVRGVQQVAEDAYDMDATGGADMVTLTENQIPSHTHTATCAEAGEHYHSYAADDMVPGNIASYMHVAYDATSTNDRNTGKYLQTSHDGDHQHDITIGSTGGGAAHNNLPPYYTLAFIMKL